MAIIDNPMISTDRVAGWFDELKDMVMQGIPPSPDRVMVLEMISNLRSRVDDYS